MKALIKPVAAVLLASVIAACSLIPTPTQPPRQDLQAPVMTAADNSQKPPEKVTFPSMVKTTPLAAPETPELDEVSALLQAFQAENGSFTTASEKNKEPKAAPSPESHRDDDHEDHKAWVVELKSKEAKGKRQIHIPETGEFKLVLETGPRFEITDRDARDGEAKIQMPAATLKTWIHLEEARDNSSLEVSDELYYVKDTLSKERQHKHHDDERAKQWFKLGLRPLPVPSDWYSPDGQAFVLRFKANQIKEFQMIWQKQRGEAPFPPGINRIGPEGGTVELPGVAELEVPAGALNENKVIVIRQKLDAILLPKEKDVAPPTYFYPNGLHFNKSAYVRLFIDPEKTKGHLPNDITYFLFSSNSEVQSEILKTADSKRRFSNRLSIYDWFLMPHFSYIRVTVDEESYHPDYIPFNEGVSTEAFQLTLNYTQVCPLSPNFDAPNQPIYFMQWGDSLNASPLNEAIKRAACSSLVNSWMDYFLLSKPTQPLKWYRFSAYGATYQGLRVEIFPIDSAGSAQIVLRPRINGAATIKLAIAIPDNIVDTSAHENFHLFQLAQTQTNEQWTQFFENNEKSWLLESSARFMGSANVFSHHAEYKQQVPALESNLTALLYLQLPYGESLGKSLELIQNNSLYTTPNREGDGEDNRYNRMGLFSLISAFYGPAKKPNTPPPGLQKIYDINRDYLEKEKYTNEGAVEQCFRMKR